MYAVLQTSLDQPITREALEAAVMSTQTLAKPDCARLLRELFGIVAEKLSQDDALGLQAGLRAQGIETDVVSQSDLPTLPAPHSLQMFKLTRDGLTVVNYTGQHTLYPMSTLVFGAGGHVKHLTAPKRKLEWAEKIAPRGGNYQGLEMVPQSQPKEVLEFRIEFYVTQEPFRFQCILDDTAIVRANEEVLKVHDRDQQDILLLNLAKSLPAAQTNLGFQKVAAGEDFLYPSVHAFEEEIIWSLYRLARDAGET